MKSPRNPVRFTFRCSTGGAYSAPISNTQGLFFGVRIVVLCLPRVTLTRKLCRAWSLIWVYPGFPTLFWGLSGFFVDDLMGKALWKLVENAQRFPRCGGRVLCVHGAGSFHRAHPYATRSPRPRTAVDP